MIGHFQHNAIYCVLMYSKHASNDDINPIGQKLRLEMKKRGLSSVDLARKADVKTSFLYDVISGKSTNPSSVKLARVAECLGVSLTYLAGSGTNTSEGYQFSLPDSVTDYVAVARMNVEVSAGGGTIVTTENPEEYYHFRKDWIRNHLRVASGDLRIVTVHGDSMEPTLCNNDMILIDTTQQHPSPSGIYVLFDGMGLVVKRLELVANPQSPKIRITSDNSHYATYECALAEANIVGRVVWFAREM